jgi:hypothetical protein
MNPKSFAHENILGTILSRNREEPSIKATEQNKSGLSQETGQTSD